MNRLPEGWHKTTLGEISQDIMYGMNAKAIPYDGEHKYIRITDIDEATNRFTPNPLSSPDGEIGEKYKLKEGDILFARTGASVGKSYLFNEQDGNLYFAGFLIKFHITQNNPIFIYSQTQNSSYWSWVKSVSMRSGQPGINAEEFRKLPLIIAPLQEQRAIANILQTWDTAIEKTEVLIAAKEKQFDWLVTHLISNQFENPNWEKVTLGDSGCCYTGLSGKNRQDFGSGKPYIPYLNIFNNSRINPKYLDYVSIRQGERQNTVKKGDVFFTISSETPEDVGTSSVLLDDIGECYLNSFCFGWRCTSREIIPEFLKYYFRSFQFRHQAVKLAQGVTRFNLSKSQLMKARIYYPDTTTQKHIAETLNTARQEIDTLKTLADRYRTQKCGLLQKLLTGKWRVKL